MVKKFGGTFSRKGPDALTEELAVVLSSKTRYEFKPLFTIVYTNLRARNLANGGEEMFRLRVYEKLQDLVRKGMVDRVVTHGVKEYSGLDSLASVRPVTPVPGINPEVAVSPGVVV